MTTKELPSRDTWSKLNLNELLDTRSRIQEIHYNALAAGATYADQYAKFILELDSLLSAKSSPPLEEK